MKVLARLVDTAVIDVLGRRRDAAVVVPRRAYGVFVTGLRGHDWLEKGLHDVGFQVVLRCNAEISQRVENDGTELEWVSV